MDLVTCSGSGLDPEISPAAAGYQAERIARERNMAVEDVEAVISRYTTGRFLGMFGEPRVNVLKVNLALDGLDLNMICLWCIELPRIAAALQLF